MRSLDMSMKEVAAPIVLSRPMPRLGRGGLWLAALGCLVAGCAATPDPTKRFEEGWLPGFVISVGTAGQLGEQRHHDCRKPTDFEGSGALFAVVSYPHGRTTREAVEPVRPGSDFASGQPIWMNHRRCEIIEAR
jgi:hypothetical protein